MKLLILTSIAESTHTHHQKHADLSTEISFSCQEEILQCNQYQNPIMKEGSEKMITDKVLVMLRGKYRE